MTQPNLQDWQTRTVITVPLDNTAVFEEVDGKMMATVRILKAGMSKNRRTYPPHVVKEAVDNKLFDGIRMFIDHDKKRPNPNERPFLDMVSAIESTSYDDASQSMIGRVQFFDRAFYERVQAAKDFMGVSINALVKGTRRVTNGQVYEDVSGWTQPRSVDWVVFPAAGGAILAFEDEDEPATKTDKNVALRDLRAAIKLHKAHMDGSEPTSEASQQKLMSLMESALAAISMTSFEDEDEPNMIDWTKVTAEELKKNNSAVFESIVAGAKAEKGLKTDPDPKGEGEKVILTQESITSMIADGVLAVLNDRDKRAEERATKQRSASDKVREAFEHSGLPTKTRARVMAGFEGVEEFDSEAVAESIKNAKEELQAAGAGPIIRGMGPSGAGGSEKAEASFSVHESVMGSFGIVREKNKEAAKEGTK